LRICYPRHLGIGLAIGVAGVCFAMTGQAVSNLK
jgi:hypothetical protein